MMTPPTRLSTEGVVRLSMALFAVPLAASGCSDGALGPSGTGGAEAFEVWIVDQSDSDHMGGFGGTLYVYDGADLAGSDPGNAVPAHTVDLAGATSALCQQETGVHPVRPHMLLFDVTGSHAILSFVASGHVVLMEGDTREPVACFRTAPGAGGARQAHAAFPAPDGSFVVIANQNGKLLERLDTDFSSGNFTYNAEATLDLVNGLTPAGLPREDAELRPDNAPICPVIASDSRHVWVTLRGGGLLVVDASETPMRIVAEYDRDVVVGNGCGGAEARGSMFVNSGGSPVNLQGAEHAFLHLHGFDVYRFPLSGYGTGGQNLPLPELVFSVGGEADSHGMVSVRDGSHVWVADRHRNVIEVIEVASGGHVGTIPLAGVYSDDPAPDLLDLSPSGDLLFAAFRGSVPLTGDPHNATGTTPGLGVISVNASGTGGELLGVSGFSNIHQGQDLADPHAVRVRPLP